MSWFISFGDWWVDFSVLAIDELISLVSVIDELISLLKAIDAL